jgi:hypothetical protein
MTKDVKRGGSMYAKGTVVYGLDKSKTFVVPNEGNISLPLAAVKFTGYGDVREVFNNTYKY